MVAPTAISNHPNYVFTNAVVTELENSVGFFFSIFFLLQTLHGTESGSLGLASAAKLQQRLIEEKFVHDRMMDCNRGKHAVSHSSARTHVYMRTHQQQPKVGCRRSAHTLLFFVACVRDRYSNGPSFNTLHMLGS